MLKKQLLKFAQEDLDLAKKQGEITIAEGKFGLMTLSYNSSLDEYQIDTPSKGWIITGPGSEIVKTLANSYNVVHDTMIEVQNIWRPM